MKKLAINFLKTADEKLRNIGKSQSATVLQTQNFTFYKNQPNQENEYHVNPQFPLEQQSTHKVVANRGTGGAGPNSIQPQSGSGTDDMDEPVVLRQLRRERNGHRISGEAEQEDFKRRSRSEGPNRRVRQSMDERANVKKQTFDGGGRGRKQHGSSDSGENDERCRQTTGGVGFDSESDSDPKKWTKNLLVVRRVRKTEKTKQSEKRFSERENGAGAKNMDEDSASRTENLGGGNSSSRDSESSTKGNNKYHKLEEMRKKRINMTVTSDEENTPASRISRLRQRALQGGLGDQLKSVSAPLASTSSYSNTYVDYTRRDHSQVPHQAHKAAPFDAGMHNLIEVNPEWRLQNVLPSNQHKAGTNPLTQSRAYTNRPFPEPIHNINPSFAIGTSTQKQSVPPTVKKPMLDFHSGLNQQSPRAQQIQTILQQSQNQKQAPVRTPPSNNSGSHQLFYTFPEPNSSQTSKTMNNCSPELAVHRFTSQMRLPYTDSIVNSTPKTGMIPGNINPTVSFSNNLKQIQARGSPIPNQELFQSINSSRSSSHFTDVDEMRSQKNIDRRIEPQPKLQNNPVAKFNSFGYNDDTLDELVQSNIQYLDSDVDKFRPIKNSSTNVSRSSSLPDPRKMSTTPSLKDQSSTQIQSNNSIQIHVSLPTEHSGLYFNQPVIQIAPPGVIAYKSKYDPVDYLMPQPDVVPRKYSYDSHSRLSRTSGEYYDRDDMSKSDSQLNAQVVMIPRYLGNNSLQPDQAYIRGCVSDINIRVDDGDDFTVSQMDRGMFSDVEYDIQVSERVKKWETFMKVHDDQLPNEQKSLILTPIQENNETDSLMLPSEVKKSVLLSKSSAFVPLYPKEIKSTQSSQSRAFSSDLSLNKSADVDALNMFCDESKTNRFFKIINDTQVARQLGGSQTQNVTSLLHTPVTSQSDNIFLSAHEIRQQMLTNRQTTPSVPRDNSQTFFPSPQYQLTEYQDGIQKGASLMARSSNLSDHRDLGKKDSRYHEEYNEIASAKTDSRINLRRRFGADSVAGTSEDDQWSVSSASAKLIRPSNTSPSHSHADSMDLFSLLPGYEPKIKDADVWSPNLETTHGVPVSIERVTARTLQTIPFSEDPFWKEIEEMTSFDPNSLAGHLSVSKALDLVTAVELVKSDVQVEQTSPQTSTLPTQARSNSLAQRDRMQRSKSLYTPNITPLSINVSEKSSSAVSVLDDVLEDINRSSIERKQLSPKKKALETSLCAVLGVSNVTDYLKIKQLQPEVGFKFEGGQFTFIKPASEPQPRATKSHASTDLSQSQPDTVIFQSKQPLQFYQQQRKDAQQLQNRQSQLLMSGVSSYHLDPNLLKQKLLNTGLVVETDTEESIIFKQTRSSSLGAPGPIFVSLSKAAQTYAPSESKGVRQKETAQLPSSFISSKSDADSPEVEPSPAAPWAVKQPGPSALYDIQNALAPFESSIYQPDTEILYDTSRLQSCNDTHFNTSKGSHVTATGWTYQPQLNQDTEIHKTPSSSSNSVSKLQKVNVSMDDLKNLAQNVERQINAIKGKLQAADEKSLDSILTSLRKLTPEAKSQVADGTDFVDYYSAKKTKLSDALTELNRIYDDLELSNSGLFHLSETGKDKPQRATKSKELFITPVSKSEHLRPMQTRVSSVFIPGLERSSSTQKLDHETESEFDILSKSFQAIVDEVNQTTDFFTQIAENNTLENVAPETKNQASKIALNSDRGNYVKTVSTSSKEKNAAFSNLSPATMLKPHEVKGKGDRLRAKLQGSFKDDENMIGKGRSKSIPGLGSNPKELLGETKENVEISNSVTTDTSSPTLLQRMRIRPVRDNKIVKDDKVAKKQGTDKASGISQSPHPSPIVNRKIIYNNGYVPDVTPHCAHVVKEETAVQSPKLHKCQITQKINSSKEMVHGITESKWTISSLGGPHKKVPPPTAAKPTRLETSSSNTVSSELVPSLVAMPSIGLQSKLQTATQFNSNKLVFPMKYIVGSIPHKASTTVNINLSPVVCEASQSKVADLKYDDTENNFSGGHREKKQIGIGLAMILDKFTIDEEIPDRIKKRLGLKSTPDLIEPLIDCQDETDPPSNETLNLKSETCVSGDKIHQTSKVVKCQTQQPADKRIPLLATEGSKSIVSKPIVVSSLERTVVDSEGKTSSSGTTTPQSPSPNRKPPQHPCKRLMSETDKQLESEVISESVMSPKFVSKIPRFIAAQRTVAPHSKSDEDNKTPKTDSHQQPIASPRAVRRERPPDRKMQTATFRERPHSFHELISCFEKGTSHVQSVQRLRRYASADEVNSRIILKKVLLPEVNPTTGNILGISGKQSSSVRCS